MYVAQYLAEQQVCFQTFVHAPAYSAQKRAHILHVPGREVVKSVLMHGPEGYFLAVLPATCHLDSNRLAELLGGPVVLATPEEICRIFTDCEVGAVHPFGSLYGINTVLDESVDPNGMIVFEGHTHSHAIRLHCRAYERLERPRRLGFAVPITSPAMSQAI